MTKQDLADAWFVRNMLSAIHGNDPSMDRAKAVEAAERLLAAVQDDINNGEKKQ